MLSTLPSRFRKPLLIVGLLIASLLALATSVLVIPVASVLLFFYFKRG